MVRVVTGTEIAAHCKPYAGVHQLFPGMRVPEQSPLAIDVARWQGEPVAVVVAATRAQAEDAVERIAVEWEPLPAVVDPFIGATSECPVIHGALGSNVVYDGTVAHGDIGATMEAAALVVESEFLFGRHTGVCLEARSILADYRASDETPTVYESHQCPAQQQDIFARLLGLSDNKVRVVCADVGGAFGIEQHLYGDEIVVCIFSRILRRPVKFVADRLESFTSDVHAREQASCGSGSSAFWPTIARNSGGTSSFAHGIVASCHPEGRCCRPDGIRARCAAAVWKPVSSILHWCRLQQSRALAPDATIRDGPQAWPCQ